MVIDTPIHRFIVRDKKPEAAEIRPDRMGNARTPGQVMGRSVQKADLYFVRGTIAPEELALLGRVLFSDPITQTFEFRACAEFAGAATTGAGDVAGDVAGGIGLSANGMGLSADGAVTVVEVALRPGVTDPVAEEIVRASRELGISGVEAAATGARYELEPGDQARGDAGAPFDLVGHVLAHFANPVIHRHAAGEIMPAFPHDADASAEVERIDIAAMDDGQLLALSRARRAALDLPEMRAVRDYFTREGRACTDVEFEAIAQTWSEHCVHKTFKALIEVRGGAAYGLPERVDNVLKTFIKAATDEIDAPWVRSAFTDNAGIVDFDDEYELSFKVETHNHPSAIEPFGGANTGVGGVIRDILGVSAAPVAVTDVLCFGPPGGAAAPAGALQPERIRDGVVAGVQDYGNKMGIPTVNGGIHYHPGYAANPLVYCGCAGMAPKGSHRNSPGVGDRVVALGGRTGRDGIRGATFSSLPMDHTTQEHSGSSVQIGAPITEKKVAEAIVAARDAGMYSAVTDCGAGGLSSAVGEMAAKLGADVELRAVTLKYPGLAPWEIWLSEAQERMVVAVPERNMAALRALCDELDVGLYDLGSFTGDGRLRVRMDGEAVLDLDCRFLHDGIPQKRLVAEAIHESHDAMGDLTKRSGDPAWLREENGAKTLLGLLAHNSIRSNAWAIRRYDHEVQGATRIGPFSGAAQAGPSDAAVLKPTATKGTQAFSLSNGFNCRYGAADSYRAAVSALDEAVRNAVASGADPERIAVLDNFCLGDPENPETVWTLLRAAQGCRDAALAHRTPFISGKDSFNNEYADAEGKRVSVPPSILVSALGILPDVRRSVTADFKRPGGLLYLVGDFRPTLAASAWSDIHGAHAALAAGGDEKIPGASPRAPDVYRALHRAMLDGLVAACHDLSDGGLAVTAAEMCVSGDLGAEIDIGALGDSIPRLLFGETNGCLLAEVARADAPAFERALAGLPCWPIGSVLTERKLSVRCAAAESGNFELDLDAMRAAYAPEGEEP